MVRSDGAFPSLIACTIFGDAMLFAAIARMVDSCLTPCAVRSTSCCGLISKCLGVLCGGAGRRLRSRLYSAFNQSSMMKPLARSIGLRSDAALARSDVGE